MNPEQQPDYDQPVAYDKEGHPLYAHPPQEPETGASEQQSVHVARAVEPAEPIIGDEMAKRHDAAVSLYPTLNLSKAEYIISEVRRHPIGLIGPVTIGGLLAAAVVGFLAFYSKFVPNNNPPFESILLPAALVLVLIGIGIYIIVQVYSNNKFFLTNESVIQEIQLSLFSRNEQTVSLSNIEDASYTQTGILQMMFNYGSIRLSTEGDETTYRFNYVADPKHQIALLNNAVEAFKNGRPVSSDD